MKRKLRIIFIPFVFIYCVYVLLAQFIHPQIESWLAQKIPSFLNELNIGEFKIEEIHFNFHNPFIQIQKISWQPNKKLNFISLSHISSIDARINFFNLLSGRINIHEIIVSELESELNLDLIPGSKSSKLPIQKIFEFLPKIPLTQLTFKKLNYKVNSKSKNVSIQAQAPELKVINDEKKILIYSLDSQVGIDFNKIQETLNVDLIADLSKDLIEIKKISVQSEIINASASGEFKSPSEILTKPQGSFLATVDFTAEKIQSHVETLTNVKLPKITGTIHTEGSLNISGLKKYTSNFKVDLEKITVEQFKIGDAHLKGAVKDKSVTVSELALIHPSGEATLKNLNFDLQTLILKSQVIIKNFDIQKLFESLHLKDIPVFAKLRGDFKECEVKFNPKLLAQCQGEMWGESLNVTSSPKESSSSIVKISDYGAIGSFLVDQNQIEYKAKVNIKNSYGHSDGVIDFKKGFSINFLTPELNAQNVDTLSGLKLEGQLKLAGKTEGDSSGATFQMQTSAKDFWFENYFLGDLNSLISYKEGILQFSDVAGQIGPSQYKGNLDINLSQSSLDGQFNSNYLEIPDVFKALSRQFELPVVISGNGKLDIKLWGPLKFNLMSYDLRSSFKQGSVLGESFQKLNLNLISRDGEVRTEDCYLNKGQSQIKLAGEMHPDMTIDARVYGTNVKLQESENLNRLNSSIFGNLNFNLSLLGPFTAPETIFRGQITNMAIADQDIQNSEFSLTLRRHYLEGQLNLIGEKITGFFSWPYEVTAPFRLNLKIDRWDFASLLSTLTGGAVQNDFISSLSGQVNLIADRGGFWKSTGIVLIDDMQIQRDQIKISNTKSMEARFIEGAITLSDFKMEGPNQIIEILSDKFSRDNLDLILKARADLKLLQILTPFLEDIGGNIDLTAQVQGPLYKPEILGQLSARNTYIKIAGLPHPIEKLNTEVSFSHSKIIISSATGQFAGGTLTGDGEIKIEGLTTLPTQIRIHIENATLNFPDQIKTSGNADLLLTGSWFPFLLSGTYNISSGLITKDFSKVSSNVGVKLSSYLPKIILNEVFESLILDVQLNLDKSIKIKNPLMDGTLFGQLQVKGNTHSPILLGEIQSKTGGKLIVNEKVFEINSLLLNFKNPQTINPEIYVSAFSRIQNYDITMLAQGFADNPQVKFTSVPPLSDQDIVSLLALGITSTSLDSNINSQEQAAQTSYQIGAAILSQNPLSKTFEQTTGWNFQLSSSFDDTKNIAVPKVSITRQINPKLNATINKNIGSDDTSSEAELQYILNPNLSINGNFEKRENSETTSLTNQNNTQNKSILGIDLEYKKEFK